MVVFENASTAVRQPWLASCHSQEALEPPARGGMEILAGIWLGPLPYDRALYRSAWKAGCPPQTDKPFLALFAMGQKRRSLPCPDMESFFSSAVNKTKSIEEERITAIYVLPLADGGS